MADDITITPAGGSWVVRAGGAVIGESTAALRLEEAGHDPVIYFPREDIAMAFLDRTDKVTTCPKKGQATYYSIVAEGGTIPNAAWSYESPLEGVGQIAGYLAFYTDEVAVEEV